MHTDHTSYYSLLALLVPTGLLKRYQETFHSYWKKVVNFAFTSIKQIHFVESVRIITLSQPILYYLGCVKCESYKNGWIKFVAAAVPVYK